MLSKNNLQQDALSVLNAVPDNYLILLPDPPRFTIAGVTDAYLKATLTKRENILGKGLFEVFPDNPDLEEVTGVRNLGASLRYVLEHKREHRMADQRYDVPNPESGGFLYKVWRPLNRPVFNAAGEVQYIIHHVEDVTALVHAEEREVKIKGIEQAYNLFMQAPAVIAIFRGKKHVLQLANAAAFKQWGKGPEIIGKPLLDSIPELMGQDIIELFDQVYNTGETYIGKAVPIAAFPLGKVERRYFDVVYQAFYEEGNNSPAGVFTISHDVTQRVEAQKRAEESEARFRTMANSIPQLAWMTDEKGWIYWYNQRWYDYTGTTPEEMLGWGWTKVHHPDLVEAVVARYTAAIEAGSSWEDTFLLRSKTGEYRWFLSRSVPVRKDDGTLIGWFGTNTDVTEQRKAEEALQRSESNLRNLVLQAPVAMCIGSGPHFIVEVANDRMLELWGKHSEEIIDHPVFEVLPKAGEKGLKQVIQQVYATGERFTANEMPVHLPRNDKVETVYLNFVYEPIKNNEGAVAKIIAVAIDVTDQVVARKKIEESHKEFQFAMDFLPQIFWLASPEGYHYYYNKQSYDYTGLSYDESKGEGWNHVLHPDDQERAWKIWRHSLNTGQPYEIEYRLRRYDGQYHWFLARALPLRDESGNITKWFGVCTDIHDQITFAEQLEKMVEERTKELHRSNEDLQQFVHVASHDLKEPLRKIIFFAGRMQDDLKEQLDENGRFYLSRISIAANRMVLMINGVLKYATVSSLDEIYEPVDLNEVVKNVLFDLDLAIQQKEATIHCTLLPQIEGASVMLQQVFYNLISNSLKFARTGIPPVITISSETIDRDGKTFARIKLKDNGIGFEQIYAEKIFGTFTRLHSKDKYEGAGLGLSLCKKIIERHCGSIKAKSAENIGSIFEILLPFHPSHTFESSNEYKEHRF